MAPRVRISLTAALMCMLAVVAAVAHQAQAIPPVNGSVPIVSVQVAASSATVTWKVDNAPASVIVEYGTDSRYGVWTPTSTLLEPGQGRSTLTGLEPSTTYQFHVIAKTPTGYSDARGSFVTPPLPGSLTASITPPPQVAGGDTSLYIAKTKTSTANASAPTGPIALYVNGSPIFPRMVWQQCPYAYPQSLAAGINLFLGTDCTTPAQQLRILGGRALSALDYTKRGVVSGPGLVGWHLPDEADESIGRANGLPTIHDSGRVTFLTLTDHFSPRMAPPSAGRSIYPAYFSRADVIGFDTYPIEGPCHPDWLDRVYVLQKDLVQMAGPKPTFQWIESGPMEKCFTVDPTPATVEAETWLAIAGGARGIGYFPGIWSPSIQAQITSINRDIASLAPALLDTTATGFAGSPGNTVRVGVRRHNGAIYVIAVNESFSPTAARLGVPGMGSRTVSVFDENRTVEAQGDQISDTFGPLAVHIYVVPPPSF